MRFCWKQVLVKFSTWAILEIFLTFLGLDTIADYSEFILQDKMQSLSISQQIQSDSW
jgi:hypothetical protein